jgi:peptidoglycan/xylan/chitin deacetylase (PgdA/CDA1 family)
MVLPVLMYHRIDVERPQADYSTVLRSATPEAFDAQMRTLAATYQPLSLETLLEVRAGLRSLPERAVMVTFDDGYSDFADHAWPIMRRHGVPVTLFVPTAFPGRTDAEFWWDRVARAFQRTPRTDLLVTPLGAFPLATARERQHACGVLTENLKTVPHEDAMRIVSETVESLVGDDHPISAVLGWADLRRLAAEGVTVAPHSRTHPMLDQIGPAQLRDEIVGSRDDIEAQLGSCPLAFSYPAGQRSRDVEAAVRESGFKVAFTTEMALNDLRRDCWLTLGRINVSPRVTPSILLPLLHPWSARLLHFAS